jgi:hypothetical protein
VYPAVSVLDRDRYGQEIAAAWIAEEKLRSDLSPGPGLRNRDPAHVSGPLPEPVRRVARLWCHRPLRLRPVALWHGPMRARGHVLVRRLANRR